MVEVIRNLKDQLLEQMEKEVGERGAERLDPDMVDMVKDLAEAEKSCWEAEYYRSVSEAMGNGSDMGYSMRRGYDNRMQGYQGRSGWQNQYGSGYSRRGYGSMGYADSVEGIRNIMMTASPEEKERMRAELRTMLDM